MVRQHTQYTLIKKHAHTHTTSVAMVSQYMVLGPSDAGYFVHDYSLSYISSTAGNDSHIIWLSVCVWVWAGV